MRVIIADDHSFTLMGTVNHVQSLGHDVVDLYNNGKSAFSGILQHEPDVAILDINMPEIDGLSILEKLLDFKLKTKVVLLTMHKELSMLKKAEKLNVSGYILKEYASDELDHCLKSLENGEKYISNDLVVHLSNLKLNDAYKQLQKLSNTERKVIELIAKGKTSREIAELLFVTEKAIEHHRANIIQKLDLKPIKNALLIWANKYLK